jgi:hypothetical protein
MGTLGADLRQAQRNAAIVSMAMLMAVVMCGIVEIPALLRLILVALNGLYRDFFVLAALSVLGILLYFPRYDAWEDWLKQRP